MAPECEWLTEFESLDIYKKTSIAKAMHNEHS